MVLLPFFFVGNTRDWRKQKGWGDSSPSRKRAGLRGCVRTTHPKWKRLVDYSRPLLEQSTFTYNLSLVHKLGLAKTIAISIAGKISSSEKSEKSVWKEFDLTAPFTEMERFWIARFFLVKANATWFPGVEGYIIQLPAIPKTYKLDLSVRVLLLEYLEFLLGPNCFSQRKLLPMKEDFWTS